MKNADPKMTFKKLVSEKPNYNDAAFQAGLGGWNPEDKILKKLRPVKFEDGLQNLLLREDKTMNNEINNLIDEYIESRKVFTLRKFYRYVVEVGFVFWCMVSISAIMFRGCTTAITRQ